MQTYRFGEFELDVEAQQLRLRGQPVRLERRPLDLLVLLVTRHGRLVGREEMIAALWPAKVIIDFESGLNTLVRKVRHALGDSSDHPHFVETVSGRGYRFIAPVVRVTEPEPDQVRLEEPHRAARWKTHYVAVLALLLLLAGGAIFVYHTGTGNPAHIRIAVLPFENLTGNEELSYLASGLAEETSTSLAQIDLPHFAVIGGVSARAIAEAAVPAREIGRELDIDFLVQSSLRVDRSRIRVTSRLIRIANSEQVWSASFDRELTNTLGLQRELSIAIAEQVRQRLSPEVAAAIDRRQTQNPEAYELYLKGRYEWSRFMPDSVSQALQYYEQAVAKDPTYALAWAGMAHALITSPVTAGVRPESVIPSARDALQRALEFGPDLAEVQLALGSFHFFVDWDYPPAEAAARKSVSLDANNAMAHMFLGVVLTQQGKHFEAGVTLRRARQLDPLFPLMFANSALVALDANDPQTALEYSTQSIAINPEFWVGHFYRGRSLLALGDYEEALKTFSDMERLSGGNRTLAMSYRAFVLARLGRHDQARDVLAELTAQPADQYVSPYNIAVVQAGLGEIDAAFESLERSLAARDVSILDLLRDPRIESLRLDPRFESLAKRCGFRPKTVELG